MKRLHALVALAALSAPISFAIAQDMGGGLAPPASQPAVAEDKTPTVLEGTWTLTSANFGGNAVEAAELEGKRIIFVGNVAHLLDKGQEVGAGDKGTFTLKPDATPKEITLTSPSDGVMNGVFELAGDELKLCFAGPGGERPKGIVDGPGMLRMTFKKAK
jgi:uncharacterized protein (TIGR03067 family)